VGAPGQRGPPTPLPPPSPANVTRREAGAGPYLKEWSSAVRPPPAVEVIMIANVTAPRTAVLDPLTRE
jgi:hypothetical protein